MKTYFERFKKFTKEDWIIIAFMALFFAVGLYFSISFSVKLGKGLTLFGDSSVSYKSGEAEMVGPTRADIIVLSLYWVLTALLILLLTYYLFFRKPKKNTVIRKDIVDGKTVILNRDEESETEQTHEGK